MTTLNPHTLQIAMTGGAFVLGMVTFGTGVFILVFNIMRRDVKEITGQTARLAQKGLAEEISGLVGNASTLIGAVNDMVRTAAGIGIFLSILGLALMALSAWLAFQIQ
jgi:hypothetical protein